MTPTRSQPTPTAKLILQAAGRTRTLPEGAAGIAEAIAQFTKRRPTRRRKRK